MPSEFGNHNEFIIQAKQQAGKAAGQAGGADAIVTVDDGDVLARRWSLATGARPISAHFGKIVPIWLSIPGQIFR